MTITTVEAPQLQAVLLMYQRQAVERAIHRAREYRADRDAEILETVAALLENLRDAIDNAFPHTTH